MERKKNYLLLLGKRSDIVCPTSVADRAGLKGRGAVGAIFAGGPL